MWINNNFLVKRNADRNRKGYYENENLEKEDCMPLFDQADKLWNRMFSAFVWLRRAE